MIYKTLKDQPAHFREASTPEPWQYIMPCGCGVNEHGLARVSTEYEGRSAGEALLVWYMKLQR